MQLPCLFMLRRCSSLKGVDVTEHALKCLLRLLCFAWRTEMRRGCAKSQSTYSVPSVSTPNAKEERKFPWRECFRAVFFDKKMQLFSCHVSRSGVHRTIITCAAAVTWWMNLYFQSSSHFFQLFFHLKRIEKGIRTQSGAQWQALAAFFILSNASASTLSQLHVRTHLCLSVLTGGGIRLCRRPSFWPTGL